MATWPRRTLLRNSGFFLDTQTTPHLDIKSLVHRAIDLFQTPLTPPSSFSSSQHYIVFMLDLDVPQKKNDTTSTVPFLHWYQPDLALDTKTGKLHVPKSSKLAKADYISPSPPPGPEHRYVELLFDQPSDYRFPAEFEKYLAKESSARVGFEILDFVEAANLKKPVAGNWFLVQERGGKEYL